MKSAFRIDHILLRILFGRRWREKVWASKADVAQLHAHITATTTPFLINLDGVERIKLSLNAPNPAYNPSLLKIPTGYLMTARSSAVHVFNDRVCVTNPDTPKDVNYVMWLDAQLNIIKYDILDESLLSKDASGWTSALEDIRLFDWRGEVWGIAAIGNRAAGAIGQVMVQLDGHRIAQYRVLPSPRGQKVEKNWIPVAHASQLKLIYSVEPLQILSMRSPMEPIRLPDGFSSVAAEVPYPFRGGSNLVPYTDGYLAVVHSAPIAYQGARMYTHHFVLFSPDLQIIEISRPFFIEHIGIEIVVSMVLQDDGVIISYGVGDRLCRLLKISHAVIDRLISCESII